MIGAATAPTRCTLQLSSPIAMTRSRESSVGVRCMWLIFVRALRTASSIAPSLISPPKTGNFDQTPIVHEEAYEYATLDVRGGAKGV